MKRDKIRKLINKQIRKEAVSYKNMIIVSALLLTLCSLAALGYFLYLSKEA